MSDKVEMSYDDYRYKFRKCVENINEVLSKEFDVEVKISSGIKDCLFVELVDQHIEFTMEKKGE